MNPRNPDFYGEETGETPVEEREEHNLIRRLRAAGLWHSDEDVPVLDPVDAVIY